MMKTERLKKLESELKDLKQWLQLGLVPKKDVPKHETEIKGIEAKIDEEQERIQFLKESGDLEEYYATRRMGTSRGGYPEGTTMGDMELTEQNTSINDASVDMETSSLDVETTDLSERKEDNTESYQTEDDDLFTDRRWRNGIMDPDSDDW